MFAKRCEFACDKPVVSLNGLCEAIHTLYIAASGSWWLDCMELQGIAEIVNSNTHSLRLLAGCSAGIQHRALSICKGRWQDNMAGREVMHQAHRALGQLFRLQGRSVHLAASNVVHSVTRDLAESSGESSSGRDALWCGSIGEVPLMDGVVGQKAMLFSGLQMARSKQGHAAARFYSGELETCLLSCLSEAVTHIFLCNAVFHLCYSTGAPAVCPSQLEHHWSHMNDNFRQAGLLPHHLAKHTFSVTGHHFSLRACDSQC